MKLKLTITALSMLAAGCSPLAPLPNHNKFFMLSPISENAASTTAAAPGSAVSIGVGPVDFPDYLRRKEVVTRTAANRIDVSDENRWAGPLDKNFTRVLTENLATLLNTQRVESYPWSLSHPVDYQVIVDVERFDTSSDKQAKLVARWSVRDGHNGKELYSTQTITSVPVGSGEEGPSAALSANLATLSREISAQISPLGRHPDNALGPPSPALSRNSTFREGQSDSAASLGAM